MPGFVSELTDLELSQFDENKRSTVIKTKKTGYPRTIVWSEKTHELLKKYISLRLKRNALKGSSALFVGWKNGIGWTMRLTPRSVERLLKGYVQKANIQEN
ncbi:MAG: tyrosine-type recombinase/integrase [Bacteroidetes bacterium]|nr:tyrosine-type recombinase/integrase [Bacteroidota bacterium]